MCYRACDMELDFATTAVELELQRTRPSFLLLCKWHCGEFQNEPVVLKNTREESPESHQCGNCSDASIPATLLDTRLTPCQQQRE